MRLNVCCLAGLLIVTHGASPPGPSDFATLADWIAYAAGPSGAQASVSLYFGVDELEGLGPQINDMVLQVADAAGPLLEYCDIGDVGTPELRPLKYDKTPAGDPPSSVFDALSLEELASAAGLEINSHVYRAVVAAIRSGKHVPVSGPPGTAKTTLAELSLRDCQRRRVLFRPSPHHRDRGLDDFKLSAACRQHVRQWA